MAFNGQNNINNKKSTVFAKQLRYSARKQRLNLAEVAA